VPGHQPQKDSGGIGWRNSGGGFGEYCHFILLQIL